MGVWRYKKRGFGEDPGEDWDPPNVSVLVPVKNEEKVIGRLLESLVRLEYPRENLEVIVVEDESIDRTLEICRGYSQRYPWIKVFHRDSSLGKGDALNYAFHQSKGEIIATFDADDIPEPLAVTKALRYFNNPETGAVHGYHRVLNLRESVVSRLAAYENFVYRLSNDGKYALRLFVTFSGSNTFFRRSALERVGLWVAKSLVEDAGLSVMMLIRLVYVGSRLAAFFSSARTDVVSHLGLVVATYPYATLVSLANLAAMVLILRKGARLWLKTEKTGYVDEQLRPSSF